MKPHIFYRKGWWRVSKCQTRVISEIRLWNMAHQFISRLNSNR